jgi:hypothetical protein
LKFYAPSFENTETSEIMDDEDILPPLELDFLNQQECEAITNLMARRNMPSNADLDLTKLVAEQLGTSLTVKEILNQN